MSRSKSAPAESTLPADYPLPLPDAVLRHHSESLFKTMRGWAELKRMPPVLLLTGPAGVGKRSVAYFLSQWLLCERSGFSQAKAAEIKAEEAAFDLFGGGSAESSVSVEAINEEAAKDPNADPVPCGSCIACQRALKASWVDFSEISVESGDGESQTLKIDQFRKLKSTLGFGAFDGTFRITLIRDADKMTVQAANSLLKILEEPPPGWVFLLTASDPSVLLPTLVSRCQILRLKPFTAEKLRYLISASDVPKERQAVSAEVAQGSWKKALAFADDEIWETRASVFRFLENPQLELNGLVEWASQEPQHLALLLDQMEQITADLIRWSVDPKDAPFKGSQDGKRAMASHTGHAVRTLGSAEVAREFWIAQAERLFKARTQLGLPLNRKITVQDVLLPWIGLGL
jgi:DNA polymerase III delta prime subunit